MSGRPDGVQGREPTDVAPPWPAYVATFVVYVALGYRFRSVVLNWIIGPLFLVLCLYVLPRLVRRGESRPAR